MGKPRRLLESSRERLHADMPRRRFTALFTEDATGWTAIDNGFIAFGVQTDFATPRLEAVSALGWATAAASAMVSVKPVVLVRDRMGLSDTETALAYVAAGDGSMLRPRLLEGHDRDRGVMLAGGLLLLRARPASPGAGRPRGTTRGKTWGSR